MEDSAYGNYIFKIQTAYVNICILLILRKYMYIIDIVGFLSSHSLLLHIPMDHRDDRNKVKGFIAKNNTTFKLKHFKVFGESPVGTLKSRK